MKCSFARVGVLAALLVDELHRVGKEPLGLVAVVEDGRAHDDELPLGLGAKVLVTDFGNARLNAFNCYGKIADLDRRANGRSGLLGGGRLLRFGGLRFLFFGLGGVLSRIVRFFGRGGGGGGLRRVTRAPREDRGEAENKKGDDSGQNLVLTDP